MNEKDANELASVNGTAALRKHMDGSGRRTPPKPSRFALVPFDQLRPSRALAYRIKGIFPRTGICVVWGPPKCGKSFWTMDAVLHVALDWTYRGRKVAPGRVVYCAFEGQEGYGNRTEAFRQRHDVPAKVPFLLMPARMDLVKEHPLFIREIAAQLGCEYDAKAGIVKGAGRPAIIVLDTLNRSLNGSETDDMGAYVRAADALREAFDCLVVIVHHCGVEGSRPRGHTSLTGAADAQIAVKRDAAGNVVATVEWMKDGPEGDTIVSRLDPVAVGTDEEGDEITTCVVEPVEGDAVPAATTTAKRLTDKQRLALDALGECVLAEGREPPAAFGLPAAVRVVAADAWRTEMEARGIIDRKGANPRAEWTRIRTQLAARRAIGERNDLVWRG